MVPPPAHLSHHSPRIRPSVLLWLWLSGCAVSAPPVDPVFVDGRAVAPAGDSLLALASPAGLVVWDRRSGRTDTLAAGIFTSPHQVQAVGNDWFVSDVRDGRAYVVQLAADGTVQRTVDVDSVASAPHQFAVLPDGGIVVESPSAALWVLRNGRWDTFALAAGSTRSGLLVAAHGGVLHAVPGQALTLYNEHGNIRWRLAWPWYEGAFVSDLAVDAQGRIHVLAGEQHRAGFVVFGLSPLNGEVVRWSAFGPHATFSVSPIGNVMPDSGAAWPPGETGR